MGLIKFRKSRAADENAKIYSLNLSPNPRFVADCLMSLDLTKALVFEFRRVCFERV